MTIPRTLFEKIWSSHVVRSMGEGLFLLHVDRHILQETASSRAFDGLRRAGRLVECPDLTFGVTDHIVSTQPGRTAATFDIGQEYIALMERNCRNSGIRLFSVNDPWQGIEHVVVPELGLALPGCTIVCADSHTATNGAFGALAWGFGTSDVEHVLATQAVALRKPKAMHVALDGRLPPSVHAKDVILHVIGRLGTNAGRGYFVEYGGTAVRAMSMEERMTICNMSIELGSRCGMVAPDDTTFEYLADRPFAPQGQLWDRALASWRALPTDDGAAFDHAVAVDCAGLAPQITWGVTPAHVDGVDGRVPDPSRNPTRSDRESIEHALDYMGLVAGTPLCEIPIDYAFIGSCTNSRLSDLRAAAAVVRGRKVAAGVRALVVPGSSAVKREAEAMGLDATFRDAGFEWRESGCSMCLAINDDVVPPGKRCISTSNRNFEHRQGPGSRTHLASPASVAAAAIAGRITDPRRFV